MRRRLINWLVFVTRPRHDIRGLLTILKRVLPGIRCIVNVRKRNTMAV